MNWTATPARRQLIVMVLLGVALAGGVLRHLAAPASLARDIGTLLMLLWLPVIGSVIGWLVARIPRRRQRASAAALTFAPERAFQPQVLVEFTLRPSQVPADNTPMGEGEHHCALVADNIGYTARWVAPPGAVLRRGVAHAMPFEFLSPGAALPHFRHATALRMMVGEAFVADGRVLQVLAPAAG